MKAILEKIIRLRNPNFNLHKDINTVILISFAWLTFWSLVRGFSLLFYLKNPKMAMLGRAVTFFNSPKIHFGKYLKLGNHVHLSALATDGIYLIIQVLSLRSVIMLALANLLTSVEQVDCRLVMNASSVNIFVVILKIIFPMISINRFDIKV